MADTAAYATTSSNNSPGSGAVQRCSSASLLASHPEFRPGAGSACPGGRRPGARACGSHSRGRNALAMAGVALSPSSPCLLAISRLNRSHASHAISTVSGPARTAIVHVKVVIPQRLGGFNVVDITGRVSAAGCRDTVPALHRPRSLERDPLPPGSGDRPRSSGRQGYREPGIRLSCEHDGMRLCRFR